MTHHHHHQQSAKSKSLVKYYLLAYNLVSFLGWSAVLLLTVSHILLPHAPVPAARAHPPPSSFLSRFLSTLPIKPLHFSHQSTVQPIPTFLPTWLAPFYLRTKTLHHSVGGVTKVVQSMALLEVAHVWLKWVRSPLQTTGMQVGSRLFIVWAIVDRFDITKTSPLYTSLLLAWSQTEVIRYLYYTLALLPAPLSDSHYIHKPSQILTYLRYTTFYILYPLGAGSEAGLIYITLPSISSFELGGGVAGSGKFSGWRVGDWARAALFVIWWPGLYVMYTYMIQQRRKVFGSAFPTISSPKTRVQISYENENGDVGDMYIGDVSTVEPPATGRKGRKKAKAQ